MACRFGIGNRWTAPALLLIAMATAAPATAGEPRAVIELFTSQGCSSCPPADKVLGELSRDPSVIALSLNVDYWDYIGWKDTLALRAHTTHQQAYARSRGDREIYTPQVVVNGVAHALGSDKAAIERAIEATRANTKPLTVPVSLTVADGKVTVSLPESAEARSGEVWLCPVIGEVSVKVDRGENRGRDLTYVNVSRGRIKLGDYTGKAVTFSVPLSEIQVDKFDRLAVVVQQSKGAQPGVMIGANFASLR